MGTVCVRARLALSGPANGSGFAEETPCGQRRQAWLRVGAEADCAAPRMGDGSATGEDL